MSIFEQLRESLPELSKNERKIAEYILQYPHDIERFSSETISSACNTSRSAVVRLCQKMKFSGYIEFKHALLQELAELKTAAPAAVPAEPCSKTIIQHYQETLQQLETIAASPALAELAADISYANRVITLGMYHSSLLAQQLTYRLNSIKVDSFVISEPGIMHRYRSILKQGDVVVIFSLSGRTAYEEIALEYCKNRVKVVLITLIPDTALSKIVDTTIVLPFFSHVSNQTILDDTPTYFLFIELLMEALNKKLNISQRIESL